MRKALAPVLGFALLLLMAGGFPLLFKGMGELGEVLIGFFPLFFEVAKKSLEDYLTSAYFITGVIMAIASACGIWFGVKGGKILFLVVSIVLEIISLASIGMNIL